MGESQQQSEPRLVVECELEPAYPYRPRAISASTEHLTGFTPREYLDNPTLFAVRVHPCLLYTSDAADE